MSTDPPKQDHSRAHADDQGDDRSLLEEARTQIEEIDQGILDLLRRRQLVSEQVAEARPARFATQLTDERQWLVEVPTDADAQAADD